MTDKIGQSVYAEVKCKRQFAEHGCDDGGYDEPEHMAVKMASLSVGPANGKEKQQDDDAFADLFEAG